MSDLAQTSIYLTAEDRKIADALMAQLGLSRSGLFRLALHRLRTADDGELRKRLLEIADELRDLA